MNTSDSINPDLLKRLFEIDPALRGMKPDCFPYSARWHIRNFVNRKLLCRSFTPTERRELRFVARQCPQPVRILFGKIHYYLFPDRSLVYKSARLYSVWASADDYVREYIDTAYCHGSALHPNDFALLALLDRGDIIRKFGTPDNIRLSR